MQEFLYLLLIDNLTYFAFAKYCNIFLASLNLHKYQTMQKTQVMQPNMQKVVKVKVVKVKETYIVI